jgi:GTP-binding protein Era
VGAMSVPEKPTRSGFVALAGRPNVGKSTLVNAIVGHKVAIVSDKPQTTRRAIRGVATQPRDWQMVLCDLPGVQRPRDMLTTRMQRRVEQELSDCDGVLFVVDGVQGVGGPGDRFIAEALKSTGTPVTIVVNKADRLDNAHTVVALQATADLDAEFELGADIFPVSAAKGTGVPALTEHLVAHLPEGPFFFGDDEVTDLREDVWLAEMVREQVLRRTRQEVPHAVEVQVEEVDEGPDLVTVRAAIWTETDSQKGILIGAGGRMVRDIGTAARKEIEREIAKRVHLDLTVRVRRAWRTDDSLLDRLGIT